MSRVIEIKGGSTDIIHDERDLCIIARENVGEDYAEELAATLAELRKLADKTERLVDTDIRSYESTLEEYANVIRDTTDLLEESLNKRNLRDSMRQAISMLRNTL